MYLFDLSKERDSLANIQVLTSRHIQKSSGFTSLYEGCYNCTKVAINELRARLFVINPE